LIRLKREQREQRHSVRPQNSVDRFVILRKERIEPGSEGGIGVTNAE